MIVDRIIRLNRIEPEQLSFMAPRGIETKVDIRFQAPAGDPTIDGVPWTQDLAAQMQLIARSSGIASYFSLATTDLVNGRARAVIPADFIDDDSGYNLAVTGTISTEPYLLATGVVRPSLSIGPEALAPDIIDNVPLTLQRDEAALIGIKVWADQSGDAPFDLTGHGTTVSASVYDGPGGSVLVPFSVTVVSSNEVTLSLTVAQVNALPDECWWSLVASTGAGLTTLAEGKVTVYGAVAPPFTPVVLTYNYTKQATLVVPAGGQIIHCDNALDVLRIDANGNEATLDQLVIGDTIQIGVTTWSLTSNISKVGTFYAAYIAPASQAAVSGTQSVTFARP